MRGIATSDAGSCDAARGGAENAATGVAGSYDESAAVLRWGTSTTGRLQPARAGAATGDTGSYDGTQRCWKRVMPKQRWARRCCEVQWQQWFEVGRCDPTTADATTVIGGS